MQDNTTNRPGKVRASKAGNNRPGGYLHRLAEVLAAHVHVGADGARYVSFGTRQARRERLMNTFRELYRLGYKLRAPSSLKQKHVTALVRHWEDKGLAAATIQNRLSDLRTLCGWIGKAGMIQPAQTYARDPASVKVKTSAERSKAWTDNGVDIAEKLKEIEARDAHVAMQVRMCLAFGLRCREAIMLAPVSADLGFVLKVRDGTKGGRERVVPVDTQLKRLMLDLAKAFVEQQPMRRLGERRGMSLKQAIKRYQNVLYSCGIRRGDLGVTGHGLRHEYLQDAYERYAGEKSPLRGGARPPDEAALRARVLVAQEAGHSRPAITTAYTGSHRHLAHVRAREQAWMDNVLLVHGEAVEAVLLEAEDAVRAAESDAVADRNAIPEQEEAGK